MNFHVNPLADIRDEIAKVDRNIANCLRHFRAAQNLEIVPTREMLERVKFPAEVENLAIEKNTPRELFAGVSLFLALTTNENEIISCRKMDHRADKKELFIALCEELCKRHDLSKQVFEYKKDNCSQFKGANGRVQTYVPEQHDSVVGRMQKTSIDNGWDYDLHAHIIGWIAAVNAGWQDMGINDNKGPFVDPVTAKLRYEIRDPRPLKLA